MGGVAGGKGSKTPDVRVRQQPHAVSGKISGSRASLVMWELIVYVCDPGRHYVRQPRCWWDPLYRQIRQ